MADYQNNDSEKDLSAEEIQAMKDRYKLPEEIEKKESPADGYMMGIHFVLSALIPALLGMWIDDVMGTKPWAFVILLILGFCSGFWYVWKKWQETNE